MIPGGIITAIGCCLLFSQIRVVDFVLYFSIGLGLVFLIWGLVERLFGLIIPGCLLLGIGPGVNIAWGNINQPNGLTQTGVMLVWFALSWIMITVFSRAITAKFVWWPLIPGGILAVVGWGLYLGGDPKAAVGFIGNSGSIGLILFGVYLLLLRRSIRH
jgi:hypothetical protein